MSEAENSYTRGEIEIDVIEYFIFTVIVSQRPILAAYVYI